MATGKFYRRKKELTDDQLNEIQDSFDLFQKDDKDSGGEARIDAEDLLVVMRALGHEPRKEDLKKLVTEVTLLARLSHPHIVEVQAVFHQIEPRTRLNMAYVQLPFYAHGDAARWLDECDPPPPLEARQRVLQQLAQALQTFHLLYLYHLI